MAMLTTIRATTTMSGWCEPESEQAQYPDLYSVYQAYRVCRRRKRGTVRACLYEQQLLDNLLNTTTALQNQTWLPAPPVVFCVEKPKVREVYAAQFQDRVVHHWLVPQLEALLDGKFIYDCASNRKDKGTHFAVKRLQYFMRKQHGGWFLQLDIANFFNTITHSTLLHLLSEHLKRAVKQGKLPKVQGQYLYQLCRKIIIQPVAHEAIVLGDGLRLEAVPNHKRLSCAPAGTGLPIGNLTSQYFANVYMNELDQFIKHQLKCKYYVRYVDDFVLVHKCKSQLQQWQCSISGFLVKRLQLTLKAQRILAPVTNGADFLGYIIKPSHILVRRRVLGYLDEKLAKFNRQLCKPLARGVLLDVKYEARENLCAVLASYWGHFKHASSYRLRHELFTKHAWLTWLFLDAQQLIPRWQPMSASRFYTQHTFFSAQYPVRYVLIQKGNQLYVFSKNVLLNTYSMGFLNTLRRRFMRAQSAFALVTEQGYLPSKIKQRALRQIWLPADSIPHNAQSFCLMPILVGNRRGTLTFNTLQELNHADSI